jgi:TPR repeat protein
MYNLGDMYYKGQGVEQSYEKAKEYYEQAAQLGHAEAQFNLGVMYYHGQGIETNMNKTKEWWQKAAAQNHDNAVKQLKIFEEM